MARNVHRGKKSDAGHVTGSREWYLNLQLRGGTGAQEFKEWHTRNNFQWQAREDKLPEYQKPQQTSTSGTDDTCQLSLYDYLNLSEGLPD